MSSAAIPPPASSGQAVATVAVTGAGGFLGGHVCQALLERGYRVRAVTHAGGNGALAHDGCGRVEQYPAEVRDPDSVAAALRDVDAVIHTAATVRIDRDPEGTAHTVNLGGTRNVIDACIAGGVRKLVHVSSIHAYGRLRGTKLGADSPLASGSQVPYGAAKARAHAAVQAAAREGQIDASVVCPSGILGPGDRRPTVVGGMLLGVAGGRLPCLVEGGYWWCDVRDVAAAIAGAVEGGAAGAVYFTTGRYASMRDLADLCSDALQRDLRRPVLPRALAVAALPFIQAYAALGRRPPLYSRNSLDLLHDCPAAVDDASARRQLAYAPRPVADTVGDALAWFQSRGMLA